jgi:hypothetical protein
MKSTDSCMYGIVQKNPKLTTDTQSTPEADKQSRNYDIGSTAPGPSKDDRYLDALGSCSAYPCVANHNTGLAMSQFNASAMTES